MCEKGLWGGGEVGLHRVMYFTPKITTTIPRKFQETRLENSSWVTVSFCCAPWVFLTSAAFGDFVWGRGFFFWYDECVHLTFFTALSTNLREIVASLLFSFSLLFSVFLFFLCVCIVFTVTRNHENSYCVFCTLFFCVTQLEVELSHLCFANCAHNTWTIIVVRTSNTVLQQMFSALYTA